MNTLIIATDANGKRHPLQTSYPAEVVNNRNKPLLRMLSIYTGTEIVAVLPY